MLATITSAAPKGIDAEIVHVEVNAGEVGEPKLILVGLPDAAVKESDDRVFSALSNSGFRPPRTRTTINLAPANLRKEGPFYDLPIHPKQVPRIDAIISAEPVKTQPAALLNGITPEEASLIWAIVSAALAQLKYIKAALEVRITVESKANILTCRQQFISSYFLRSGK